MHSDELSAATGFALVWLTGSSAGRVPALPIINLLDKSRFNRIRRQKLARRIRNRQLLTNATLHGKPAKKLVTGAEPKPVVA